MSLKELDIEDVISQMTLEEKARIISGKDFWSTMPIPRLNIPSIRCSDGPGGVRGIKFLSEMTPTASIPSGSKLACSWNTELLHEVGKMMGEQARAKGTHLLLAPNVNLARSPLGGRSFESLGEDPLLAGILASHLVQGIQEQKVMVCPKHLACNDKEDSRMQMNSVVSERALREIYMLPFMLLCKHATPESFMTAYNKINGQHASENKHLMKDILQEEWGYEGTYISDWFGTASCADSINNGLHLEMPGPAIWRGKLVENAVYHNTISQEALDECVRGVLRLVNGAIRSGIPLDKEEELLNTPETSALTRQAARESLVLLKNEGLLPLQKKKKVLLVGESAKWANTCAGGACTTIPYYAVTLYDALVENLGAENVDWVKGAPNRKTLPSPALYAKEKGAKIKYSTYDEPRSVKDRKALSETYVPDIDVFIFEFNRGLIRPGHRFNATYSITINVPESAKYRFNLKVAGTTRALLDGEVVAEHVANYATGSDMGMNAPETFTEIYLEAGRDYLFEVDFESTCSGLSPGSLGCGIEKAVSTEEYLQEAADVAKNYDQVVVLTGLTKDYETEGIDRKTMDLPDNQDKLIENVLDSNPNAVVVLESGTPVSLPWEKKAKAILHSGYLGQELGNALYDVLFGDYNPSGKLSFSWPKRFEDSSSATSFKYDNTMSLTYADDIYMGYRHHDISKIEPLYAFGHGLSYTSFKFDNLKVEVCEDTIELTVDVENTGDVTGSTVVQAYVSHLTSSVPTAVKGLKGFTKVEVEKGATVTAKVSMDKKLACSFYDTSIKKWLLEKGDYQVSVGSSSDNIEVVETFSIEKSAKWIKL